MFFSASAANLTFRVGAPGSYPLIRAASITGPGFTSLQVFNTATSCALLGTVVRDAVSMTILVTAASNVPCVPLNVTSTSSGLSDAAIAGIVVGCVVAG